MPKNVIPQDSHSKYDAISEVYKKVGFSKFSWENNFLPSANLTKKLTFRKS